MLGDGGASLDAFGLGETLAGTAYIIMATPSMSEVFSGLHQFNFLDNITLLFTGLFTTVKHLYPETSYFFDFLNCDRFIFL